MRKISTGAAAAKAFYEGLIFKPRWHMPAKIKKQSRSIEGQQTLWGDPDHLRETRAREEEARTKISK